MLRVAHLTPAYFSPDSYVGGGERYIDYLIRSLGRHSDLTQCVFTIGTDDQLFERDGVPVRVMQNDSTMAFQPNSFSPAVWMELRGFDLVHVHQSLTVFGAYNAAIVRSMRIPVVGTDLGGGENAMMLAGRGIELFDGVISISEYAKDLIGKFYTGPHEVLIGPVDTDTFVPSLRVNRDRSQVLCVSRIMPHKGIDRIIAALPLGLRLTVVGHVYHQEYFELLQRMANGKEVRFVVDANDDQLLHLYQTSSLLVQASTAKDVYGNRVAKPELMGLTTLEAMSCGLPVIVSDAGSLPELVPDDRFGRVFSDHRELSDAFSEFLSGTWPSIDAGALARAHTIENHGTAAIATRLAEFYKQIISSGGRYVI